jgi:hypothetical protein
MNPKSEIYEWIDRYLNNEMNELERREFEAKLSTDEALAKTMEAQKVANKIVIGEQLLQLKEQMSFDLNDGGKYPGGSNKTWWYYISGALIVTGIILYFLIQDTNTTAIKSTPVNNQIAKEPVPAPDTAINTIETKRAKTTELSEKNSKTKNQPNSLDKNQANSIFKKFADCKDSTINFSCQARGSCLQKEEAPIEIDIKTIKSGDAPYRFSIFPDGDFKETPLLSDLKPGKYHLYVKDSKQCLRKLNVEIEVPAINCPK